MITCADVAVEFRGEILASQTWIVTSFVLLPNWLSRHVRQRANIFHEQRISYRLFVMVNTLHDRTHSLLLDMVILLNLKWAVPNFPCCSPLAIRQV